MYFYMQIKLGAVAERLLRLYKTKIGSILRFIDNRKEWCRNGNLYVYRVICLNPAEKQ